MLFILILIAMAFAFYLGHVHGSICTAKAMRAIYNLTPKKDDE